MPASSWDGFIDRERRAKRAEVSARIEALIAAPDVPATTALAPFADRHTYPIAGAYLQAIVHPGVLAILLERSAIHEAVILRRLANAFGIERPCDRWHGDAREWIDRALRNPRKRERALCVLALAGKVDSWATAPRLMRAAWFLGALARAVRP